MSKKDNDLIRFDWALNRLLRHKADHTILEGFLTSLLGRKITIMRFLESESNREYEDNKQNRVDILAENDLGEKILIEVQNEPENTFFQRMLFGVSRLVSEYLKKGDDYGKVAKVYSINIVYFKLGVGTEHVYCGTTEFRGLHTGEILNLPEHLKGKFHVSEISSIFPEYYILRVDDFDKWSRDPLEQWLYFLSTSKIPNDADAPGLEEAREQLKISSMTNEQRRDYYNYLDNMNSMRGVVEYAVDKASFEGREQGRKEGIEEGRREGIEEGRREAMYGTAKNLIKLGMTTELIAAATNLSIKEIENLR